MPDEEDIKKAVYIKLGIAAVALATAILLLGVWHSNPAVIYQWEETANNVADNPTGMFYAQNNYTSEELGEEFVMSQEDVDFANRNYRERTVENVYCTPLNSDNELDLWTSDVLVANETYAQFSRDNCPVYVGAEGILHTHPIGDNELSGTDEELIRETEVDFNCIQYGVMNGEPGEDLSSVSCYSLDSEGLVQEHPVVLEG